MPFMEYTILSNFVILVPEIPGSSEVALILHLNLYLFWATWSSSWWVSLFISSFSEMQSIKWQVQEHMFNLVTFAF